MPQIVMMTYEMPNEIRKIAEEGEVNEFNLNEFLEQKKLMILFNLFIRMLFKNGFL